MSPEEEKHFLWAIPPVLFALYYIPKVACIAGLIASLLLHCKAWYSRKSLYMKRLISQTCFDLLALAVCSLALYYAPNLLRAAFFLGAAATAAYYNKERLCEFLGPRAGRALLDGRRAASPEKLLPVWAILTVLLSLYYVPAAVLFAGFVILSLHCWAWYRRQSLYLKQLIAQSGVDLFGLAVCALGLYYVPDCLRVTVLGACAAAACYHNRQRLRAGFRGLDARRVPAVLAGLWRPLRDGSAAPTTADGLSPIPGSVPVSPRCVPILLVALWRRLSTGSFVLTAGGLSLVRESARQISSCFSRLCPIPGMSTWGATSGLTSGGGLDPNEGKRSEPDHVSEDIHRDRSVLCAKMDGHLPAFGPEGATASGEERSLSSQSS